MSEKWNVTDDNLPSEEHAQRLIAARMNQNSRMSGWDGYEFRVGPSEFHKNGSFQIEARKVSKKNFKQLEEQLQNRSVPLEESSLSRLHSHLSNRNIGIITAHRGNLPADENVARNRQLENHIRQAGYGFFHIDGHYTENMGTPEARPVKERAYLVVGKPGDDDGELKGFLKKHGEAFDQDSVLYKQHDQPDAKLIGTTRRESWLGHGEESSVGTWHPNRAGEFHSALHNSQTFQFESSALVETYGSNYFSEWAKSLASRA